MTAARVERRLAAILAADVAGYSRLMGADEEGTLARLKACRQALVDPEDRRASRPHRQDHRRRHAGRVRQRRRCGALRRRGAARHGRRAMPTCRRTSASSSASASMSATSSSTTTTSSATASTSRPGSKAIAEPGGICISDDAHRQVRGKLEIAFDDMGEQTLKNIAEPVRVWRVRPGRRTAAVRRPSSGLRLLPCPTSPRSRCCRSRT